MRAELAQEVKGNWSCIMTYGMEEKRRGVVEDYTLPFEVLKYNHGEAAPHMIARTAQVRGG